MSENINISKINHRLKKANELFPEYLAEDIFKYFSVSTISEEEKNSIKEEYLLSLGRWGKVNLINSTIGYAIRLMNSDSLLEYEEIHKLYSLFDAIYSMENIGLYPDPVLKKIYTQTQNEFILKKEYERSKLVAQDKIENWKKKWEWYQW
jgi:hypothetical protein